MPSPSLIAIVDDDDSMRAALVRLVRSLGHEARAFASAEDFLHSDTIGAAACVISDIQMPGMSGIELKLTLAAQNLLQPVIMITARADPSLEDQARASGAFCFLRKPFDADELVGCLERALGIGS